MTTNRTVNRWLDSFTKCLFTVEFVLMVIIEVKWEELKSLSYLYPRDQRLGWDSLLSRCVEGKTQNANEALHGLLWSKCPKTVFVFQSTLTMRISEGICEYNTGYLTTIYETQQACGLIKSPGTNTIKIVNRFDKIRLRIAEKRGTKNFNVSEK